MLSQYQRSILGKAFLTRRLYKEYVTSYRSWVGRKLWYKRKGENDDILLFPRWCVQKLRDTNVFIFLTPKN